MDPAVFEAFDRICRDEQAGGDVFEIGASLGTRRCCNCRACRRRDR